MIDHRLSKAKAEIERMYRSLKDDEDVRMGTFDETWSDKQRLTRFEDRSVYADLTPPMYSYVLTQYLRMGISEMDPVSFKDMEEAVNKLKACGCLVLIEKSFDPKSNSLHDLVLSGQYPDKETWEIAYQFQTFNETQFWVRHLASLLQPDTSLKDLWHVIGFTPKKVPKGNKK